MKEDMQQASTQEFFDRAFVWDAHSGVFPSPEVDLNVLENWRQNSVNYISMNVGFDVMDWQDTLATLAAYRRWIMNNADRFTLATSMQDIEQARVDGKLAVGFDIEGMNALNGDLNMVGVYHALGVRQMLFAYNLNNVAAGGCHDSDSGLTPLGKQIVGEVNRVGMLVDCSHAGYKTTMDIMSESSQPVVFSHSNPVVVWNHQRNITDEQIKACAKTGGVIGMNGMGIFIGDNDISNATLINHIRYVRDLVGPDHIGIGFDYSPKMDIDIGVILRSRPDFWPAGQQYDTKDIKHAGPDQLLDLTEQLLANGFSESDTRGILGENFKRVATKAWQGS
jgi:membrane dipeptidase